MDFSLLRSAFHGGFSAKGQTVVRAALFLLLGVMLALWPGIAVGQTLAITLGNVVLYLCIYTLPMGWGAVSVCGAGCIAWLIQGKGLLAVAVVVVRLMAFMGGKALFVCSTSQGANRLVIPAIWCGVALLAGHFCYDSAFYGVFHLFMERMVSQPSPVGDGIQKQAFPAAVNVLHTLPSFRESRHPCCI